MNTGISYTNMTIKQACEYLGIDRRTFNRDYIKTEKIKLFVLPGQCAKVLTEDIVRLKQSYTFTHKEFQLHNIIGG